MTINSRGLAGQPILPYIDYRAYTGTDVYLDLTFLDHTGVGNIPQSISYQIDDMTNSVNMVPMTSVPVTGYQQTLQIPASVLTMTRQFQGSQICQVLITALLGDGSNVSTVTVIELCAIQ